MCPLPGDDDTDPRLEVSDLNATFSSLANETFFDVATEQIANLLNVYYTPLLVALGSIGNLLSVFVFYNSKLWLQSTSQYLSVLALSDTVFLIQLLPPWMNAVRLTGVFHREGFCQIFVYTSYVTCSLSAWLVVAFTVERFVAVLYPLKRNVICTVKRARHVIGTLVFLSMILNLPVVRFAVPSEKDCNIDFEYLDQAATFNIVDTALSFTLPLAIIIVLNTWIMVGVWRLERSHARPCRRLSGQRSQQRITQMLLIVSSVFVVLNLPAYTMRILAYANDMSEKEYSGRWAALQQLCLLFFNTNFGINFLLYCLSGQNFRSALYQVMQWRRHRASGLIRMRRLPASHQRASISTSVLSTETALAPAGPASAATPATPHYRRDDCLRRWVFDNTKRRTTTQACPHPPHPPIATNDVRSARTTCGNNPGTQST